MVSLLGSVCLKAGNPCLHRFRHCARLITLPNAWSSGKSLKRVSSSSRTVLQLRLQKASLSLSSRYNRRLTSRNSTLSGHFSSLYWSKACRYAESKGMSSCRGKLRKLYFSYCARTQKEKQNKRNASLRQCDEEAMVPYGNPKVHRVGREQDPPADSPRPQNPSARSLPPCS